MTDSSPTRKETFDAPVREAIDPERALAFVRQQAAERDSSHGWFYANTGAARIKDAASAAQQLLAVHHDLVVRQKRGARAGRRHHAQELSALLSTTDDTTLVLAMAYLQTVFGLLPRSRAQSGD